MFNAFDPASYPLREPERLSAGDRWVWKRPDLSAEFAPATYALSYVARREDDPSSAISITASETGGEYVVEVSSATTAGYAAGSYVWSAYITRASDSERYEVGSGLWSVSVNRAASTVDTRSYAQRTLAAIEAYLSDPGNLAAASYQLNGRAVSQHPRAELIKERSELRAEVARVIKADRLAKGLATAGKISVRFTA